MPTRLAASISSVPAGACTARPSMVKFTESGIKCYQFSHRGGNSAQFSFKLIAELLDDRDSGQRGGIPKRTEGSAEHVLREFANKIDIGGDADPRVESSKHFLEPERAFAAWNTPSATFVLIEAHNAEAGAHHVCGVIHHHHAAGPQHALRLG